MPFGIRLDPYASYNFLVEIEGILAGGFTQVSGLTIETDIERKRFGGENIGYSFIKGVRYTDLTLQKGLTDLDLLWGWYNEILKGNIRKKNGTVYLRDHSGIPVMGWDFYQAYPIKWEGPTLDAKNNTVATETLVLTYHSLTKQSGLFGLK